MDFENLEELKTLRARGVLSEEQFERHYNRMAQRVLNDRKEKVRSKNGLVYLLLAYFTGTIGLHNFYAGYYKRGGVQLFLTLISFYMYYIPLLVTAFWALAEFLFINHSAGGIRFRGSWAVIWLWRLAGLAFLAFQYYRGQDYLLSAGL